MCSWMNHVHVCDGEPLTGKRNFVFVREQWDQELWASQKLLFSGPWTLYYIVTGFLGYHRALRAYAPRHCRWDPRSVSVCWWMCVYVDTPTVPIVGGLFSLFPSIACKFCQENLSVCLTSLTVCVLFWLLQKTVGTRSRVQWRLKWTRTSSGCCTGMSGRSVGVWADLTRLCMLVLWSMILLQRIGCGTPNDGDTMMLMCSTRMFSTNLHIFGCLTVVCESIWIFECTNRYLWLL